MTPSKPGQKCRLIGSWSLDTEGKQGPNHGKVVTTLWRHEEMAADRVPVWRVSGTNLVSSYGGTGSEVDALDYWLEVIEPDEAPPAQIKRELVETE
jgi:hypothetical protein